MKSWQSKEAQARRAIEDQSFIVQDASANCPNIDLVVFGKKTQRHTYKSNRRKSLLDQTQ